MEYYLVNGRYSFTHYGKAKSFADRIGGHIELKKTMNPFKIMIASM